LQTWSFFASHDTVPFLTTMFKLLIVQYNFIDYRVYLWYPFSVSTTSAGSKWSWQIRSPAVGIHFIFIFTNHRFKSSLSFGKEKRRALFLHNMHFMLNVDFIDSNHFLSPFWYTICLEEKRVQFLFTSCTLYSTLYIIGSLAREITTMVPETPLSWQRRHLKTFVEFSHSIFLFILSLPPTPH